MGVVFEQQMENINKALEKIRQMQPEASKLQKSLAKVRMNPMNASIEVAKKGLKTLLTLLDAVYNKTKMIVFAGLAAVAGLGMWGSKENEKKQASKDLGYKNAAEAHAMQSTGKIMGRGDQFYEAGGKLNQSVYDLEGKDEHFVNLGLDRQSMQNLSTMEKIAKTIEAIQKQKAFQQGGALYTQAEQSLQEIAGMSVQQAMSINLREFRGNFNDQYSSAKDAGLDKMANMGSKWERMLASFQIFATKIASSLSSGFGTLFDSISKGLKGLMNDKGFKDFLKSLNDMFSNFADGASDKIGDFIADIPNLMRSLQNFFLTISNFIQDLSTWKLIGWEDKNNHDKIHRNIELNKKTIRDNQVQNFLHNAKRQYEKGIKFEYNEAYDIMRNSQRRMALEKELNVTRQDLEKAVTQGISLREVVRQKKEVQQKQKVEVDVKVNVDSPYNTMVMTKSKQKIY
ncbi:hypothetical protein CQA53_02725 [Helicobacter didelphidarum]|uniref:Uncharacterized protein n=1 Tax=Helicobacter didelphidarum TaxID=2040648 RepID=A0A3D8IPY7_9HELI|nr:hypothetical protein [Helicobacter didelphidarum]RDU66704.1 hypothetical protein CQA53_02725 [Helicobacter didelphidarum]